jgi:hypothetical protein
LRFHGIDEKPVPACLGRYGFFMPRWIKSIPFWKSLIKIMQVNLNWEM